MAARTQRAVRAGRAGQRSRLTRDLGLPHIILRGDRRVKHRPAAPGAPGWSPGLRRCRPVRFLTVTRIMSIKPLFRVAAALVFVLFSSRGNALREQRMPRVLRTDEALPLSSLWRNPSNFSELVYAATIVHTTSVHHFNYTLSLNQEVVFLDDSPDLQAGLEGVAKAARRAATPRRSLRGYPG